MPATGSRAEWNAGMATLRSPTPKATVGMTGPRSEHLQRRETPRPCAGRKARLMEFYFNAYAPNRNRS